MKSLVCISKTPDTTSKISFVDNNTRFNEDGIQYIMNPYDEWYALVRAIELKEEKGGSVTAINIGTSSNDIIIRKALAIGADDAVRVDMVPSCAYDVAREIASYARDKEFDIIFLGKETIDHNGSEIGGMVAEILDMPYVSFAVHMEHDGSVAKITREIEGGEEVIELKGPMVVSAAKGMAEQRIPNMRGIMMAKRKPLEIIPGGTPSNWTQVKRYELPDPKSGVKLVDPENMDELVRLLHEEAKII
jgi:electron transfer flavoprotein beta subunit